MAIHRENTIQELCQKLRLDYKTVVLCHDTYMLAYSNPHKSWVVLKFNHDLEGYAQCPEYKHKYFSEAEKAVRYFNYLCNSF